MKICAKCNLSKEDACFNKRASSKDKLSSYCKVCNRKFKAQWAIENADRVKEANLRWYEANQDIIKEKRIKEYSSNGDKIRRNKKQHYCSNKQRFRELHKKYYNSNIERIKDYRRKYYEENKEYLKKLSANISKERIKRDLNFKLCVSLRSRLNNAIKKGQKNGSAIRDLGCTIEELKLHLESQFQPGMTWDNWSRDGWHIDHVVPLSSFDLTDREQFLKACHYTNLRPLWAKENLSKGNRL